MRKNTPQLEARLARVERALAELQKAMTHRHDQRWYRQIVGDFAGDKAFARIIRLGRQIRRGKLKS
jgi:hypothetical protein